MIIYGLKDSADSDDGYIEYFLHKERAIEALKAAREMNKEKNPNPIMYDVDMCIAQFSIGRYRHIYIITQEVIE